MIILVAQTVTIMLLLQFCYTMSDQTTQNHAIDLNLIYSKSADQELSNEVLNVKILHLFFHFEIVSDTVAYLGSIRVWYFLSIVPVSGFEVIRIINLSRRIDSWLHVLE